MMTRIKRLSMMLLTIILKLRKKTGAIEFPHVLPGMQLGGVRMQSYIMIFQSSPVDIEKRS